MGVAVPDVIREDVSYLYVEGGNNGPGTGPPESDDEVLNVVRLYASMTGYFASFLKQVPNQSIYFAVRFTLLNRFPILHGLYEIVFHPFFLVTFASSYLHVIETV